MFSEQFYICYINLTREWQLLIFYGDFSWNMAYLAGVFVLTMKIPVRFQRVYIKNTVQENFGASFYLS